MQQVLQSLFDGTTSVVDVPIPQVPRCGVLVRTTRSLISAGTERMLVDFGRAGWVDKARQQPEKVREVLQKMRTDGIAQTMDAVRSKLDQPLPLGYCSVGTISAIGSEVMNLAPGDRVVSNGPHAQVVAVSRNLCARIPDGVTDDEAAFTVLGAIALQGLRLAAPTLGERFVVIGLGLIGLLAVQLLRANGCGVLAVDLDPKKTDLARQFGADVVTLRSGDDPLAAAAAFSQYRGVDGVLIAAATSSNDPVTQAARMCRKRGRIILIGVAGLELNRSDFYEKELSFQVSCSYGPGRYEPEYEELGRDYPAGFVRWTEQRNFEAVLEMMAMGHLDVRPLITHRFALADAPAAYQLLTQHVEAYLGILLEYEPTTEPVAMASSVRLKNASERSHPAVRSPRIAVIGAGNYAGRVLIPAFAACDARLQAIASTGGVTAAHYGRKYGFVTATSNAEELIDAPDIDAIVVATRHDSHARFVVRALEARKHIFVEKPLAISLDQLEEIGAAWQRSGSVGERPLIAVGFNRRFAPHAVRMKELLASLPQPKCFMVTVNAGPVPSSHWTRDVRVGGGRLIGEGCHFVDLLRFLAGHSIVDATVKRLGSDDSVVFTLGFADGSCGTVHYLANGHSSFPKERVEVFCGGRILQLDNFRRLSGKGWPGFSRMNLWRQDKGQQACAAAFVSSITQGGPAPIDFAELHEVSRVTIELGEAARR